MTTSRNGCCSAEMTQLLYRELTAPEQAALESHLNECPLCCEALERTAASEPEWNAVRNALGQETQWNEQTPWSAVDADSASRSARPYRELLSPTDDPQMMGRIAGYEIVGILGQGGMGIVFKGFEAPLNRYVAIKVMAPQFATSGTARQRFFREAQAAAGVVHEHVIAIHCVAMWQDIPYLVMPYIRGMSLQKRIDREGPLQLRELLRIGLQVASGLAAAHAQGLIHRDVKPANILLETGVERVYLTDFGLARAVDDIRLTRTDTLVGTPQYMSPEQTNDESLDFRSDLFSLGSVLYEAATGRPAFQAATSYGVIRRINEQQPVPIQDVNSEIPAWFVQIVNRLMEKNPADRFQTAEEVAALLRECLQHVEQPRLKELPHSLTQTLASSSPRFRRMLMSTIVLALLVAGGSWLLPVTPVTSSPGPIEKGNQKSSSVKYSTAQELKAGAALVNAGKIQDSREPLEAALRLAKDDQEIKLRIYQALLPAYRESPEFEPFQKAAEYIIENHPQDASRSLTRRAYLSFAFNRGQMQNLVKRYENVLKKDKDNWMALYLLSEIYSSGAGLPNDVSHAERAVEVTEQLAKINARRDRAAGQEEADRTPAELAAISREKSKLAQQYMRAKEYRKAAELYEEIAAYDPTTHAWNLKEAAIAWLKLEDRENAERLALAAEEAPPEVRNEQLTYFFERQLGDTFLALGHPDKAIPHFEAALKKTTIPGYTDATNVELQKAIRARDE